jgi:hypothetical protein
MGNAQNLFLSLCHISTDLKIKIYKIIILPVVLGVKYGV